MIFLDCGNIDRMPVDFLRDGGNDVVNIDHHHDNTRFGDVNLVDVEASCTAEIVYELAGLLGVKITPRSPRPSTSASSPTPASSCTRTPTPAPTGSPPTLVEAGVDVNDVYRRLYEHVPIEKLRLVARALEKIERHCDGRLVDHLHLRRGLRGDRRRRGDDRGDHRPPARDRRAPGSPPWSATRATAAAPPARSACARATATSTSPRSPASTAAAATCAPPASRPTRVRGARRVPQRRGRRPARA